jgi:hypothetical protein
MSRELTSEGDVLRLRSCDWPGCSLGGAHRAPKSPHELDSHYWFCLEHVRTYNAQWDFFAGMTQAEIEAFQRDNATWHRPTWPLGDRPTQTPREPPANRRTRQALAELQLGAEVGLKDIKNRYKQLAKRYHPDANGGDKRAEERLKRINEAYEYLLARGSA